MRTRLAPRSSPPGACGGEGAEPAAAGREASGGRRGRRCAPSTACSRRSARSAIPARARSSRPRATGARSTASRSRSARSATRSAAASPAADVAERRAPPDGTKVRFEARRPRGSPASQTAAGRAARRAAPASRSLATIVYDATRRAEVNARAAGVVRGFAVDDRRAQSCSGAPLATIESADGRRRALAPVGRPRPREAGRGDPAARAQSCCAEGIAPEKDVLAGRGRRSTRPRAELAAARASLGMVGGGQAAPAATRHGAARPAP